MQKHVMGAGFLLLVICGSVASALISPLKILNGHTSFSQGDLKSPKPADSLNITGASMVYQSTSYGANAVGWYSITDADNDSKKEIMYGCYDHYIRLLECSGDNAYSIIWSYLTGSDGGFGMADDIDGDGQVEIAVGSTYEGANVYVFQNTGDNTYNLEYNNKPNTGAYRVMVGDFDADGNKEILDGDEGGFYIYQTTGINSYALGSSNPCGWGQTVGMDVEYLDGDSKMDLVFSNNGNNQLEIWESTATNSYVKRWNTTTELVTGEVGEVCVGNFDGDIEPDIAWATGTGSSLVFFENNGDNNYTEVRRLPQTNCTRASYLTHADLNGDGKDEVILGTNHDIRIFQSTLDNEYVLVYTLFLSNTINGGITAGFLDGDGNPEIVTAEETPGNVHYLQIYELSGNSDFTPPTIGIVTGEADPILDTVDQVLSCTVTDSGGSDLAWARIFYRTGGQNWDTNRYATVSGGVATIPEAAYSEGHVVYYFVGAKDNANNANYRHSTGITISENTARANAFYFSVTGTVPQGVSITLNGGAASTSSTSVTLTLSATGASRMAFSNDNLVWSQWEPFATSKSWTLAGGFGTKTVYFKCLNSFGSSSVAQDGITYASGTPQGLSITINNNAASTTQNIVSLTVTATGARDMCFSNDGITWSTWQAFATQKSWTLSEGYGSKTVYFKARSSAGSAGPVSDTIQFESPAPPVNTPDFNQKLQGKDVFSRTIFTEAVRNFVNAMGTAIWNTLSSSHISINTELDLSKYPAVTTIIGFAPTLTLSVEAWKESSTIFIEVEIGAFIEKECALSGKLDFVNKLLTCVGFVPGVKVTIDVGGSLKLAISWNVQTGAIGISEWGIGLYAEFKIIGQWITVLTNFVNPGLAYAISVADGAIKLVTGYSLLDLATGQLSLKVEYSIGSNTQEGWFSSLTFTPKATALFIDTNNDDDPEFECGIGGEGYIRWNRTGTFYGGQVSAYAALKVWSYNLGGELILFSWVSGPKSGGLRMGTITSPYTSVRTASTPLDTDSDGLYDAWETFLGTSISNPDTDGDGFGDYAEVVYNTNPLSADSDADGLCDYDEIFAYHSSPIQSDTDGDSVGDYTEVILNGTLPWSNDSDCDFLSDGEEFTQGTDPLNRDTDGDGFLDGREVKLYLTDPLSAISRPTDTDGDGLVYLDEDELGSNASINEFLIDSDNDSIPDAIEDNVFHTNKSLPDTDGDAYSDLFELSNGTDPINPLDYPGSGYTLLDSDSDGVPDLVELYHYGTNPTSTDTDGDGYSDDVEIQSGSNPASSSSIPSRTYTSNFDQFAGISLDNPDDEPLPWIDILIWIAIGAGFVALIMIYVRLRGKKYKAVKEKESAEIDIDWNDSN